MIILNQAALAAARNERNAVRYQTKSAYCSKQARQCLFSDNAEAATEWQTEAEWYAKQAMYWLGKLINLNQGA